MSSAIISPSSNPRGKKNKAAAAEIATGEKVKKIKTQKKPTCAPKPTPPGTTSVKKDRDTKTYEAHYTTYCFSKDDPNKTEPVSVYFLGSFPNKVGADAAVAGFLQYPAPAGGDASDLALIKSFDKITKKEPEITSVKTEKMTATKKSKKEIPKEISMEIGTVKTKTKTKTKKEVIKKDEKSKKVSPTK